MTVHLHDHGAILELVVEHPPVNAFTIGDLHDLAAALRGVEGRSAVRAVVLRAEGRGFSAGGDVKEVESLSEFDGILGQASGSEAASLAVAECAAPVVAAVHGYCIGVGALLAGTADVLLAAAGTRFVLAEIDNGATAGVVQLLGLLPPKRLRAVMLTAEPVDVAELVAHGSVYRLVDPPDLVGAAFDVAEVIASKSPEVVRRLKRALNSTTGMDDLRTRYRQELSYTYELNLLGEAQRRRGDFLQGDRAGYLARASGSEPDD